MDPVEIDKFLLNLPLVERTLRNGELVSWTGEKPWEARYSRYWRLSHSGATAGSGTCCLSSAPASVTASS